MAPFEKLRAWQTAHETVLHVYRSTRTWPEHEKYQLVAQSRRAAFSIAANIAEGAAKRGPREFRRFLDIALGSSAELRYTLLVARDLEYLVPEDWAKLEAVRDTAGKLLWKLYQSLRDK